MDICKRKTLPASLQLVLQCLRHLQCSRAGLRKWGNATDKMQLCRSMSVGIEINGRGGYGGGEKC